MRKEERAIVTEASWIGQWKKDRQRAFTPALVGGGRNQLIYLLDAPHLRRCIEKGGKAPDGRNQPRLSERTEVDGCNLQQWQEPSSRGEEVLRTMRSPMPANSSAAWARRTGSHPVQGVPEAFPIVLTPYHGTNSAIQDLGRYIRQPERVRRPQHVPVRLARRRAIMGAGRTRGFDRRA